MRPEEWSGDDLVAALEAPVEPPFAGGLVLVTSPPRRPPSRSAVDERLRNLPVVVAAAPHVAVGEARDLVDLELADGRDLDLLVRAVTHTPLAAQSAAVLLRRGAGASSVDDGLHVESAVFAALQAGPEHARWLAGRRARERPAGAGPRVGVERSGATLRITLTRPEVRNALDAPMRDQLLEALAIAEAEPSLAVELRGDGPVFCSGGDLDEFGSLADPASAHLIRMRRSAAAVLHRLARRTTAFVHGDNAGSGVELMAFAGRVVAHPDATFALPELAMGLVPGAGGTVSVARRIGRHRTARLVLLGERIDAPTARSWNLVDEIRLF